MLSPIFFIKTAREYVFNFFDHERIFCKLADGDKLYAGQEHT